MYNSVYFEISGACNARCPWCQTGLKRISGRQEKPHFVSIEDFRKVVRKFRAKRLISSETIISLYNWYEPFLHPQFKEIVGELHRIEQPFRISTNASKLVLFSGNELQYCSMLRISLPGFSQSSYDKVHGFNFERILENIVGMVKNFRANGFKGDVQLAFLAYQFNLNELAACRIFADRIGASLSASAASFNGLSMMMSYLDNTMPYDQLKKASKELLLYYMDDVVAACPNDWECPQHEVLVVDEHCNIVICCGPDKDEPDYLVGNALELSVEEILAKKEAKKSSALCKKCMSLGAPYIGSNLLRLSI